MNLKSTWSVDKRIICLVWFSSLIFQFGGQTFSGNSRLKAINLSHNPIKRLKGMQFPSLPYLKVRVKIKQIDIITFNFSKKILILWNTDSAVDSNIFTLSFQTLDFSHCLISHIDRKAFSSLSSSVEAIVLKGNRLCSLQVSETNVKLSSWCYQNVFLTPQASSIFFIDALTVVIQKDIFLTTTNIKSLELHQNPWKCDCHLKQFR